MWALELKDMPDIWEIWNLITLNLTHLRLPQCCITNSSIRDLQYYQIQAFAIRDTVHPNRISARRESSCFLLKDLPRILSLPFWIARFWKRLGIISFVKILRAIPTHMKNLQMGDQSIVNDAGFFQGIILPLLHRRSKLMITTVSRGLTIH